MLDTLFCVIAAFKNVISQLTLFILCVFARGKRTCGREQDENLLVPGFVEVACMVFLHVCMCPIALCSFCEGSSLIKMVFHPIFVSEA